MLFSQRYFRALNENRIAVEIPDAARRKLWTWLMANNSSIGVQRDPNDRWISNSSILEEAETELLIEHGWEQIPAVPSLRDLDNGAHQTLRYVVFEGDGKYVFDLLELAGRQMDQTEREALRQKVNEIFELHECLWRLSDGEFFRLDTDFVGARLASMSHDALTANKFAGAADEYAKARQFLAGGEIREAIYFAGHSFESVMKVLTGLDQANADRLIKELLARGFFDDLPESVRAGFGDQVLKGLPFLRNKLGGHGQGASVLKIPQIYGDLAVQLAAALHNFLIGKHLERAPPPPKTPDTPSHKLSLDDEIPF